MKIKLNDLSPLRYPGSKKGLVKYICKIFECNDNRPDIFVEPFAGGCNVSLHLLINGLVKKIIIADKDKLISSFWEVLFSDPLHLIDFIQRVDINLSNFYRYKEIAKSSKNTRKYELAEACLFLNRTSFSGLLTNRVGPIGGKAQKSGYKINCRFNKNNMIERIVNLSALSESVIVLGESWQDTIDFCIKWFENNTIYNSILFYLDPPFFYKADDLYREYFGNTEHRELYERLSNLAYDWILSYDNSREIVELYSNGNYKNINIDMPYSINSNAQRRERELIISPLKLPHFNSRNRQTYSIN